MLSQQDVIPALLAACPSFTRPWEEHLAWWGDDERGAFNDTGAFAQHVVESFSLGRVDEFPALFAAIEDLLVNGDEDCHGLTIVGVLESIQTIASNKPFGDDVFVRWLGPKSAQAWRELEVLWSGKQSLADVIRAQRSRRP